MLKSRLALATLAVAMLALPAIAKRGITSEDYFAFEFASDAHLSPDARQVAYVQTTVDQKANRRRTSVWSVDTDGKSAPRRLTAESNNSNAPRWSPDGSKLAFLSSRGEPAGNQIWILPMNGGEALQLTHVKSNVAGYQWSPDGKRFLLTSRTGPGDNIAADKKWTNLIGYIQVDEPDYRGISPATLAVDYAKMKAAYPTMPVVMNLNGAGPLWGYSSVTQAGYKEYLKTADWISQDLYPIAGHNRPSALDAPGQAAALLSQWSGGKRQITIIEAADMEAPNPQGNYPGVTADQFRAEVWNAIIGGSTGIVYFPQRIGGAGFLWENMTPAVEAEMKTTNARLTRIGDAIMAQMNPVGITATPSTGLRVTWRKYGGKTYLIALNNTNTTIAAGKISTTGVTANTTATVDSENRAIAVKGGVITDTFKPYEAHVYLVA